MSDEPIRFIASDNQSEYVSPGTPLPVDIQGATLSLDADGVEIKNDAGNPIPIEDAGGSITVDGPLTDTELRATAVPVDGSGVTQPVSVSGVVGTITGLEIPAHDYIDLSYTGANLTSVVYKDGGSGGTTVATLTLAYDGSDNLTSITKS